MEKSGNEILNELRQELSELRARMDELDRKIALCGPVEKETPASSSWDEPIDIMMDDEVAFVVPSRKEELEAKPLAAAKEPESFLESELAAPAVKKTAPKKAAKSQGKAQAWHTDTPASPLSDILSGIAIRDRGIFINTLFKEDAQLFVDSMKAFNSMNSLQQAEEYIQENFPEWNLSADVVYRFMMAVRRKLG